MPSDRPRPHEPPTDAPLSARETDILDFERWAWTRPGVKADAIVERFELSPSRYYQILAQLCERPEAMHHDPLLVRRLRRMRDQRRRARFEGRSEPGRSSR